MRWAGHVARIAKIINIFIYIYNTAVGMSEGKRPLVRPRRALEDNIRMDLKEIGYGLHETGSGWAPVNTIKN
jgi:hypothetical protein